MPRTTRISSVVSFVSAVLFLLFFQSAKHRRLWTGLNPFARDPYDALEAFAAQFAFLIGLLSLVRAFRSYSSSSPLRSQQLLIVRGQWLVTALVLVALLADMAALLAHVPLWAGSAAGRWLAATVTVFLGLTLWGARLLYGGALRLVRHRRRSPWLTALGLTGAALLALVLYPESWRSGVGGNLAAPVLGLLALLLPAWALGRCLESPASGYFEDAVDDLVALWRGRTRRRPGELTGSGWGSAVRRHGVWMLLLAGFVAGLLLALGATVAGQNLMRSAQLSGMVSGIETGGLLCAYLLLGRMLGLMRRS